MKPDVRARIQSLGDDLEQELLELALREQPDDFEILVRLGEVYAHRGRRHQGLTVDLQLVALAPDDPIVRYNLACSLALTGKLQSAFASLREAVRLGYSDVHHLLQDADLAGLRRHPMFEEILRLVRARQRRRATELEC